MAPSNNRLPPLPEPMEPAATHTPKQPETTSKPNRKTTANRFAVLNEFVDCSLDGLTKVDLIVWLVLYRDTRNGTARTSQADIARRGGVSVRAVQYATSRMEKRGLIRCVHRGGLNRGPSRWRVLPTANAPPQATGEAGFVSTDEKRCHQHTKPASSIP